MPAAWPLIALFVGYPLWWALGVGQFAYWLFAIPMAWALVRIHRERPGGLRLPPGMWLWVLFVLWAVAGLALLGLTPSGAMPGGAGYVAAGTRLLNYLTLTVLLLYVGNLSSTELPTRLVAGLLGWLGLVTVAGGLLGTFAPSFEFTSPMEMLLPAHIAADSYVQALVRPASAQIMDVLGYEAARPKAPWEYTNAWGNNLSLLLIWLVVGWLCLGAGWQRWVAGIALGLAVIPVVHSLNRALWAGLALSVAFAAYQLLRRGHLRAVLGTGLALLLVATVVLASPLRDTISDRAENPHSDEGRAAASIAAVAAATESPLVGWGSTRDARGSNSSIAIGQSPDCPQCGNNTIGNNGQLWLLLIAHGWVGAALFLGFLAQAAWRYRGDTSLVGRGALLTILLFFWYMLFYVSLIAPLATTMIALALLWRRAAERADTRAPQRTSLER
ncbi:ligase [Lipingzhangella sp. LS1_29]|uniref:Ligase n=1 Tax=Lipingzhangella rawalii TaxID=2055835 RepID=A0ABU2H3C5_9ACTN|nr:ligase [Lipingzhangella rawalii]MDS1269801.1 ligase [Lipingzhangella rawalii]